VGWQRLKEQHPELEELVGEVTFPDINGITKGKPSPVVDLEGWLRCPVPR
jgi:hypothetical protein